MNKKMQVDQIKVANRYAEVPYIPLTPEEIAQGKSGVVYMPYKTICTHVLISDVTGTRKYRQVSYWYLFKLWLYKMTKIKYIFKSL